MHVVMGAQRGPGVPWSWSYSQVPEVMLGAESWSPG